MDEDNYQVSITEHLEQHFLSNNADINSFVNELKIKGEYESPLFGKDSGYFKPAINGEKYILRHVHLPPLVDKQQKKKWLSAFKTRGRKTSNRVLVYVKNDKDNYLLINIFSEPDAHEIAEMKSKENMDIMNFLAKVAEEFIYNNSIIM